MLQGAFQQGIAVPQPQSMEAQMPAWLMPLFLSLTATSSPSSYLAAWKLHLGGGNQGLLPPKT